MEKLKKQIEALAVSYLSEVIDIRRHLHRHPELSWEETETADFICSKLGEYGISYRKGMAGTGVVGLIRGKDPDCRCIALRADMDALPVQELNAVDYMSEFPGKMHACGHDVHMASLLGTAKILQELREAFRGSIKLIFQPSEETYPGGALSMIHEGVLEDPQTEFILAQHVINTLESGDVGFKAGAYMASTDEVFLTVKGKGGHAATPNLNVDPVLIASHIILALQQIVSRIADPLMPTVVSFGRIIGEGRTNIIPDEVRVEGTLRTYDETWRKEMHNQILKISTAIAEGMGGQCEVKIAQGYPFLYNDPRLTAYLQELAADYLGADHVKDLEKRMTAEDFSYFARQRPSCLYRLGTANEAKGINANLHSAWFDVDESSLKTGMGLMAWFSIKLLNKK